MAAEKFGAEVYGAEVNVVGKDGIAYLEDFFQFEDLLAPHPEF